MKKKKFLAVFSTMAIAASMLAAMPASAANYTAVAAGGTTEVQKYLVLDKDAEVPTATFNYTITAGAEKKYEGKNSIAAYAGIMPSGTTGITGTVSFAAGDTTVNGAIDDGITNSTDKKYVKKGFNLNFSGVSFPEPGVYRYVLTEDKAGDTDDLGAGIKHVGNYQKTLDVYVTDNDGTLGVERYILYNSIIKSAPDISNNAELDDKVNRTDTTNTAKTDGFVNEYESKSLSFAKKVEGNQGSKDKYFKFTVKIENALGANLKVLMDNAETAPTVNNATVYTAEVMAEANGIDDIDENTAAGQQLVIDSNEKSYDFYLQNGQYITLEGLPKGASYTVSEDAEEYTAADGATFGTGTSAIAFTDAKEGGIGAADVKTGFTNTKDGTIPTGVILSIAGPAVLGIAVVGGIVYMTLKRKKEEEQD